MADSKLHNEPWFKDNRPIGEAARLAEELRNSDIYSLAQLEGYVNGTMRELADLLISKHKDYGPKNISDSPGGPINGLRVRMHDKLARINNLFDNKVDPNYESLEDSFKDMANYAIIGLLVLRGQWDK